MRLFLWKRGDGAITGQSAKIALAMRNFSRREFLMSASAATLAASATKSFSASHMRQRLFVASGQPDGIQFFDWNPLGENSALRALQPKSALFDWICFSHDRKYLFAASEVDSFNGKPTGELASYSVEDGKLEQLSAQNSRRKGTCHCASIILAACSSRRIMAAEAQPVSK